MRLRAQRLAALKVGKVAHRVVYDADFLNDDMVMISESNLLASIVDGQAVYTAPALNYITEK